MTLDQQGRGPRDLDERLRAALGERAARVDDRVVPSLAAAARAAASSSARGIERHRRLTPPRAWRPVAAAVARLALVFGIVWSAGLWWPDRPDIVRHPAVPATSSESSAPEPSSGPVRAAWRSQPGPSDVESRALAAALPVATAYVAGLDRPDCAPRGRLVTGDACGPVAITAAALGRDAPWVSGLTRAGEIVEVTYPVVVTVDRQLGNWNAGRNDRFLTVRHVRGALWRAIELATGPGPRYRVPAATPADRAAARAVLTDLLAGLRHRDCALVRAATTSQQLRGLCGQVRLTSYRLADAVGDAQEPAEGGGQKRVAVDVAMDVADGLRLMPHGLYRHQFFVHQAMDGSWRVADLAWPASDGSRVPPRTWPPPARSSTASSRRSPAVTAEWPISSGRLGRTATSAGCCPRPTSRSPAPGCRSVTARWDS